MGNRIRPDDDYDRPSEETLGHQRNARRSKNGERQLDYEKKNRDPTKEDPSIDDFGGKIRIDALVVVVVLVQLLGIIAAGVEIYVYALDQNWNNIAAGEAPIDEIKEHKAFKEKTLRLKGHLYLEKTKEHVTRNEYQELFFIIFMLGFVIISFIQMFMCYIKSADVEKNAIILIALYAVGGACCIFSSIFLISAAINIENEYTYAAEMLHNFQYLSTEAPVSSSNQNQCQKGEYKNGCDHYEYSKIQARALEKIFKLCGAGSRFTRYYSPVDDESTSVEIEGEVYFRDELKEMGFCSRDGFKFTAATLAILMGILCSIVPILFCCQGKSRRVEDFAEPETTRGILKPKAGEDGPIPRKVEQQEEPKRKEKRRSSTPDQSVVIAQFREYVERDSTGD